jgi:pyridoxine 4-dehydrogenase
LNYCEKNNLAFIPWAPVVAGKLTEPDGPLEEIGKRHKATVTQLSIAWLLHRSPVMLPIPGTSSVKHLEENTGAARVKLSPEEWKQIEDSAKS